MGLIRWANERIKGMTVWDIGVLKVCVGLFGIVIGAYISEFVAQKFVIC